jgi:hypothetical protein
MLCVTVRVESVRVVVDVESDTAESIGEDVKVEEVDRKNEYFDNEHTGKASRGGESAA